MTCFYFIITDSYWGAYSTSMSHSASSKRTTRKFPKAADKVLDAPNLIDDFCESINVVQFSLLTDMI